MECIYTHSNFSKRYPETSWAPPTRWINEKTHTLKWQALGASWDPTERPEKPENTTAFSLQSIQATGISPEGACTQAYTPDFTAAAPEIDPQMAWLWQSKALAFMSPTRLQQATKQLLTNSPLIAQWENHWAKSPTFHYFHERGLPVCFKSCKFSRNLWAGWGFSHDQGSWWTSLMPPPSSQLQC